MDITGLGLGIVDLTASGLPAADSPVIRKLAGSKPQQGKYGLAYEHFKALGKEQEGIEISVALDNWLSFKGIETLINTYIAPLQEAPDKNGRIHCSMNLNTETGRLSCRKPNLQNQPAGDKDVYKIRKAFVAEPGNSLIVADYGQLELRILAHMTNCQGMIEAFKLGGDFHSRTALVSSTHSPPIAAGHVSRNSKFAERRQMPPGVGLLAGRATCSPAQRCIWRPQKESEDHEFQYCVRKDGAWLYERLELLPRRS